MKLKNIPLLDLDGQLIPERDGMDRVQANAQPTTVAKCLRLILLQPAPQGESYTPETATERFLAAIVCHRTPDGGEFEIDDKVAKRLRGDCVRTFAPIISGQLALILNGQEVPIRRHVAAVAEPVVAGALGHGG